MRQPHPRAKRTLSFPKSHARLSRTVTRHPFLHALAVRPFGPAPRFFVYTNDPPLAMTARDQADDSGESTGEEEANLLYWADRHVVLRHQEEHIPLLQNQRRKPRIKYMPSIALIPIMDEERALIFQQFWSCWWKVIHHKLPFLRARKTFGAQARKRVRLESGYFADFIISTSCVDGVRVNFTFKRSSC